MKTSDYIIFCLYLGLGALQAQQLYLLKVDNMAFKVVVLLSAAFFIFNMLNHWLSVKNHILVRKCLTIKEKRMKQIDDHAKLVKLYSEKIERLNKLIIVMGDEIDKLKGKK